MGNSESSKAASNKCIIEAKSFLSNGDERGAFAVLRKGADGGNVMACYDCGFMMIQRIGYEKKDLRGLELIWKGRKLEEQEGDEGWKSEGSATDALEPQCVYFHCLFSWISTFHFSFTNP